MVDGIRNKPTPEVERIYERNASVGQFLKRLHDAQPAQKEATRLDPIIEKIWSKKVSICGWSENAHRQKIGRPVCCCS